jgi:hypothetical protein
LVATVDGAHLFAEAYLTTNLFAPSASNVPLAVPRGVEMVNELDPCVGQRAFNTGKLHKRPPESSGGIWIPEVEAPTVVARPVGQAKVNEANKKKKKKEMSDVKELNMVYVLWTTV